MSMMLIYSCKGQNTESEGLGSYDISANDKQIVFSYSKNGVSSIYVINNDGTNLKKLIGSNNGDNFYNPKYSPDGKMLAFVLNKKGSINSTLCLSNTDGSGILYLTDDMQIITEATFSLNGEHIYYCKANVYEKYSSIGRKDAHDFDIYSVHIKDKKTTKISNLKSYGLSNISDLDDSYMLIHLEAGPDGGMYLYAKDNATEPKRIIPINNPRQDASLYYTPIYSDTLKTIGFTAPYEIYIMNLKEKKAKLVFSNKGSNDLSNIAFYKNQKKILFSKVGSSDLFSINIDGTGLRTIPINIR
jgi:Tol biopolymer transport system component